MPRLTPIAGALAAATALVLSPTFGIAQGVNQTLERIDQLQQQAPARQRALNLARNTVVQLNGGLSQYMPAACMFASGGSGGSCLVSSTDQGFLFRFNGGAPGWQQLGKPPTITSEILISPDGRTVGQVIYNGPLR
jgi:hypothetical protein